MTAEDKDNALPAEFAPTEQPLRGFAADEMVACNECLRANPPTRTSCVYCGAKLPVSETNAALIRPTLKPLEEWEQGLNVVLLPTGPGEVSAEAIAGAASLLRLEPERMRAIAGAGSPLPVARATTEEEAELVVERMRSFGFRTRVFPDEALAATSHPPRRARALELDGDALTCWTSFDNQPERVRWTDLALFVSGRIFSKKVEIEEQRGRTGGRGGIVEARELVTDEAVLDIFPTRDEGHFGWRIAAESFDYSCLGERKGLLARENFLTLIQLLRERVPAAAFDDGYARLRQLLQAAWPLTERTEAQGLRLGRGGRLNTEAVTLISNESQFTRYSRLRWRLALSDAKK